MSKDNMSKLRILLNKSGLTRKEFAEKFGVSNSTLYRYEDEVHNRYVRFLIDVANHFGVTVDWLLTSQFDGKAHRLAMVYVDDEELHLLEQYRDLGEDAKSRIASLMDTLRKQANENIEE